MWIYKLLILKAPGIMKFMASGAGFLQAV